VLLLLLLRVFEVACTSESRIKSKRKIRKRIGIKSKSKIKIHFTQRKTPGRFRMADQGSTTDVRSQQSLKLSNHGVSCFSVSVLVCKRQDRRYSRVTQWMITLFGRSPKGLGDLRFLGRQRQVLKRCRPFF
jgi:hypothetical protein